MARSSRPRSSRQSAVPKQEIHCPKCGATFMVLETALEVRLKCGRCKTAFTPRNLLRKSSRKGPGVGGPSSSMVTFVIAGVLLVTIAIFVTNHFASDEPAKKEKTYKTSDPAYTVAEQRLMKLPVDRLEQWITGVQADIKKDLRRLTDYPAFFNALPTADRPTGKKGKPLPFNELEALDKIKWKKAVIDALVAGELTEPFKGKKYLQGTINVQGSEAAPLARTKITLTSQFNIPPDVRRKWEIIFNMTNIGTLEKPTWKISGLKMGQVPAEKKKKKKRKLVVPAGMDASKLKAAKDKAGETGGTHYRHPVVSLGHLKDTPEELRKEIDTLIDKLADPATKRPYEISQRLIDIGRPAFPKLLNLFYDVHKGEDPDSLESRSTLTRVIVHVLVPMTDCNYGYDPRSAGMDLEVQKAAREVALEKYYGWWAMNSSKQYWDNWKKKREKEMNTRIEGL